jgi:hypothetical protein
VVYVENTSFLTPLRATHQLRVHCPPNEDAPRLNKVWRFDCAQNDAKVGVVRQAARVATRRFHVFHHFGPAPENAVVKRSQMIAPTARFNGETKQI